MTKVRVMEDGDSAGGNMNSGYEYEVERDEKISRSSQLLLYSEARLPFGTLAAARKIIGHYLDWKVASLCNRCAANGCISNGISHSQIIGFPAPTRKYISRGMLYLSDLGNVPPAAIFRCGFDPLRDVSLKYDAELKQAAIEAACRHFETLAHGFLQMSCRLFHGTMGQQKLGGRESKRLSYRN
jgi:acetyl esterase/lipase